MRRMMMVMGAVVAMVTGAWADETERAANGVQAKERLEVDGTLELAGEIAAGMDEGDETVVSATNLVLVGDVTVGAVAEGGKGRAILTFSSIVANDYQITLTSNGVVRSIGPEPVDVSAVFAPTDGAAGNRGASGRRGHESRDQGRRSGLLLHALQVRRRHGRPDGRGA